MDNEEKEKFLSINNPKLVELYEKLTGEQLPWYRYKEPLMNSDTIKELEQLSEKNAVPFDLVRNMILSVYHNKYFSQDQYRLNRGSSPSIFERHVQNVLLLIY